MRHFLKLSVARKALINWAKAQQYKQRENLSKLVSGAYIACAGMLIVILSDRFIEPSMQQELLALIGIIIVAIGFIRAISGHLGMSLAVIIRHITRDKHD